MAKDTEEKPDQDSVKNEVYQAFLEFPEEFRPKLDEQNNRLIFKSPFAEYPGTLTTIFRISAEDYDKFWQKSYNGQDDDDHRHWAVYAWETRFHLSKNWSLQNVESADITENALHLPDQRIAIWFVQCTQPIIYLSTSLPNWLTPSNTF
jgi:hypothetical protein